MTDDEILSEYSEEISVGIAKYINEYNITGSGHEEFANIYKKRFIEGFRKGEARGEARRNIAIAKKMLAKDKSINEIAEFTGLSVREIVMLKTADD